jgi:GNAT superfamily N-acetyltransferase
VRVRSATAEDLEGVTNTLALAFEHDPTWSWAFPDYDDLETWWRMFINSALRYPWVLIADDYAAAASWIPPGGSELTEAAESALRPLLAELVGDRADQVYELLERFDAAHPHEEPHYYLSLLGTHPDHRGKGLGMSLLAESLARIDSEGQPAYLESSNPANDERYARLGFERIGEFTTPDDAHVIGCMWRPARSAA